MKLDSIVTRKPLLESIQYGMTVEQRRIVEGIVREFMPLYEATLTKDQIDQLFGTIEKDPSSRTAIGKGVDIAKKANEIINNIGKWMQDTTPVEGADNKFEQLKAKVGAKFPELDKKLTGLGTWMKDNPGKTAAIIGVMTSLAALAGGPTGGAIAGQVLRGASELIKGEKLSTAIGKGLKTAAVGYALGKLVDVGKEVVAGIGGEKIEAIAYEFRGTGKGISQINIDPDTKQAVGKIMFQNKVLDPSDAGYANAVKVLMKDVSKWNAANPGGADAYLSGFESVILQQRPLSEGQVYLVFQRLDEGPFDAVKKVAGKAADAVGGAIAKGAKKVGTALTQKNTAQGLAKAWTRAGSPTDSDELYKFLLAQNINKDALDKIYSDMKFPVPQNVQEPETEPEVTGGDVTGAKPSTATDTDTEPTSTTTGTPAPTRGSAITSANVKKQIQALADQIRGVGPQFVNRVRTELAKSIG